MTREERTKRAKGIRLGIEEGVDDLAAHFEGGIYGDDEEIEVEGRRAGRLEKGLRTVEGDDSGVRADGTSAPTIGQAIGGGPPGRLPSGGGPTGRRPLPSEAGRRDVGPYHRGGGPPGRFP